jgi:hypothetical protein
MDSRRPIRPSFAGAGWSGPTPRDVWLLLGIVFSTFSFQFFAATAWIPAMLRLTPAVWQRGWIWQVVTFPFAGIGAPSLWIVLELFILLLFSRDVFLRLGRKRFWRLLLGVSASAGVIAAIIALLQGLAGAPLLDLGMPLVQGQRTLLAILIAAFATLNGDATIYLFFVLPIRAKWFLGLEILFAFLGFLGTHDLAGFLGICTAVGVTWWCLSGGRPAGRALWLEFRQRYLKARIARLRKKSGLTVLPGGRDDPWVH